ncbi:hypothetical protein HB904_05895 [Listeria booriae]|uniref:Uncharacterized protein n=1 Tax=Listeria booriae TaxID=1552123 RepID=A0A842ACM8_9LIST|nr:hypothetical protein [Listeria booriae]
MKAPKGWRVKLDPEALNMTLNPKGTNIVSQHKALKRKAVSFHSNQQNTLFKNI